mmetsp:Transcript_13858/g.20732  ORF Transcript_13858/g.20732 Transcript_13858/m.20732 type:complete len:326 (+) Transcript_13858:198-1175(+)|eukprot:CAMPEP_0185032800 /NCGR_PEP_ID=MMETSP1103-20130426/21227_1 /TAXON_ID=36769 /ORGANISM="Paraphysomonas bandaiensis, Strain Caron Lab Isolate" /LENGTH=325 /DNA_ID=CAMNT_0027568831 /DNA_START=114 /DNA_END=1091 /DNA_ORIENTATION=-
MSTETEEVRPILLDVLAAVVRQAILDLITETDCTFTRFLTGLLELPITSDVNPIANECRDTIIGYPIKPYYLVVANAMYYCSCAGNLPRLSPMELYGIQELDVFHQDPTQMIVNVVDDIAESLEVHSQCNPINGFWGYIWCKLSSSSLCSSDTGDYNMIEVPTPYVSTNSTIKVPKRVIANMRELLLTMGTRGISLILGLRTTVGSADLCPPDRELLLEAFNEPHTPSSDLSLSSYQQPIQTKQKGKKKSILTVGARAVCKHAHRSSENFWGDCTGPEAKKNITAFQLVEKLMNSCSWINIHNMSGVQNSDIIIEVRTLEGYGAR